MFIAVPTGIKIFNWIATMWGGSIRFTTSMLFAIGFIVMFIIGGLSGVMHAVAPSDTQQSDTYFVVAHLHYVLFGGSILGLFAGVYYWWPKFTGRVMSELLGKVQFWLFFIGMNVTFFPMHFLGLDGMPRRVATYGGETGWEFWNAFSTAGVFLIGLSIVVFVHNVIWTARNGKKAGNDPWDARTLEWSIPSPPPEYNFAELPTVKVRDAFWAEKYSEGPDGRPIPKVQGAAVAAEEKEHNIHMPTPSYYPILLAMGITLIAGGLVSHVSVSVIGGILALFAIYSWAFEPATAPNAPDSSKKRGLLTFMAVNVHPPEHYTSTGLSHRKLLMWIFLGSECLFFGSLIATHLINRNKADLLHGLPPSCVLDIPITSVSTFVLLMSSVSMVLAVAAAERADMKQVRIWILATAVLGTIFLLFQVYEFQAFVNEGLTIGTNLFGSTFFTLTGFHGVHVTIGVIWLISPPGDQLQTRRHAGGRAAERGHCRSLLALRGYRLDSNLHRVYLVGAIGLSCAEVA